MVTCLDLLFLSHLSDYSIESLLPYNASASTDYNKKEAAIEVQKQRAIQYWEVSNNGDEQKQNMHSTVLQHLNNGLVLPIFHTLCRNIHERLYSPNASASIRSPDIDKIQLSYDPVQEGKAKENSVGKLLLRAQTSYIPAFLTSDKTEQRANFLVKDDQRTWEFNEDYVNLVSRLVNAPATMAGDGIEVTELAEAFPLDELNGCNLITRSLSRGVVADCFEKSHKGSDYAIVGSPGIGKSWTLLYALQQALLYENACVVLYFQKNSNAIACIRNQNHIYVWERQDDFIHNSYLFNNSNVLLLLDPCESSKGGAKYDEGKRMLIMATSNNAKHLRSMKKVTPGSARYLSPFTDKELGTAIPYMVDSQNLSSKELAQVIDDVLKRARQVGNLPQYIISDESFAERMHDVTEAIENLKKDDIQEILDFEAITKKKPNVPWCIFAVHVEIDLYENNENADELEEFERLDIDNIGYDGQRIKNYGVCVLMIISKMAASLLHAWGKS
jgi:hypothetical protein